MCWLEDIQFSVTAPQWPLEARQGPVHQTVLSFSQIVNQEQGRMESGGIGYISIFAAGSGKPLAGDSGINTH